MLMLLVLAIAPACDTLDEIKLSEEPAPTYVQPVYTIDTFNGTVTDTTSNGIMWDKCAYGETWSAPICSSDPATDTYANAVNYCDSLNRGGYTDWRLPTISELMTLQYDEIPAVDYSWFDLYGTRKSNYWISSTMQTNVMVYSVKLDSASLETSAYTSSSPYYIRCARSIQP